MVIKEKMVMGETMVCNGSESNGLHCHEAKRVPKADLKDKDVPPMLVFMMDPANICTLSGAVLSTISVAFIWQDRYNLALTLNVMANILDIADGPISRATPGRHPALGLVGAKLDTYSDMVSHFVVPACMLMRLSEMSMVCTGVASGWVVAGVFRQAYFEVSGRLDDGKCIYGVTSDNMPVVVAIAMHLLGVVGRDRMTIILCFCTLAMIYGALTTTLRTRNYSGYNLLFSELFLISLTTSCLVLTLTQEHVAEVNWSSFAGLSFVVHLLLGYPCYFRFIELNKS